MLDAALEMVLWEVLTQGLRADTFLAGGGSGDIMGSEPVDGGRPLGAQR
jgi:hypothetical protein